MKLFRRDGASEYLNRKLMVIYCQECAGRFLVLSERCKERKPVNVEKPYYDKTTRDQELKRRNLPPFLIFQPLGVWRTICPTFVAVSE